MCKYCRGPHPFARQDCANGDFGMVRLEILDGAIVYFVSGLAAGYTNINFCPFCGREITEEERNEDT